MEERIKELSKYRYETSLEDLEDARIMYENGRYKNALNRADYLDFFIASKDEAEKQIKRAELFSDSIREFLKGKSII